MGIFGQIEGHRDDGDDSAGYESSEFTKRLVYYPGYRGFFQRSNAELCLSPMKIDGFPQSGIL